MRAAAPLLAVLSLALGGCLQVEEILTVYPDGSGKISLSVGIKRSMLKLMEAGARQEGVPVDKVKEEILNPAALFGDTAGVVAIQPGSVAEDGEWMRSSAVAYFEDVNKLRLDKGGNQGEFRARLSPGALSLTNRLNDVQDGFRKGFNEGARQRGADPEQVKAALEFIKPLAEGLKVSVVVHAPAPITRAEGFMSADGSTASTLVDGETFIAFVTDPEGPVSKRFKDLSGRREIRVEWDAAAAPSGAPESFKAELAAARSGGRRPPGKAAAPAAPEKPRSLGAEADQLTDDEVDRLFIEAQLKVAREQIQRGQKDKARATLQGVLKDFPKAKAAQEAKKLLDTLN